MNLPQSLNKYAAALAEGAAILRAIKDMGVRADALAAILGTSKSEASHLIRDAALLTDADLNTASKKQLPLAKLTTIAKGIRTAANKDIDHAAFKTELLNTADQLTVDELKRFITSYLETARSISPRKSHLRFSATPDIDGMKHALWKLPAAQLTRIQVMLKEDALALLHSRHAVDLAEGYAIAAYNRIVGGVAATDADPLDLRHNVTLLVPLAQATCMTDGRIVNSDGELVNIKDIVTHTINPHGWAVPMLPTEDGGTVCLEPIPIQRRANASQRVLSILEHLVCAHPDCSIPAAICDIHHIISYASGGPTEPWNLAPLCRYHNKLNDDDRNHPKNGHITHIKGRNLVALHQTDGTIRANLHPAIRRGAKAQADAILNADTRTAHNKHSCACHTWYPEAKLQVAQLDIQDMHNRAQTIKQQE
ncbi:HNH endonuclease [Corynebacterium mustelae]|uniref:HNH endonuclease n=1 Tax=Corynebacterium mustelae TaxID=571915 RepID=A0A0G3H0L8_9CORY|nr:HNH endonuclease signature motif containing protein [Corynebacterium mustelae]AKK06956.1 HNH endonuclease [Corynebacterium mustelae]